MQGTIHRLIRGKGFGFIQTEERQYFFHHTEVRGIEFRQLTVGDVVEFQPVAEEVGNHRAVEVLVLVKAPAPPPRAPAPPKAERERPRERAAPSQGPGRGPARPARRPPRESDGFGSGLFEPDDAFEEPRALGDNPEDAAGEEFSEELPAYGSGGRTGDGEHTPNRGYGHGGHGRPHVENGHGGHRRPGNFSRGNFRKPVGRPGVGRPGGRPRPPRGDDRPQRPRATGVTGERGEGVIRSINPERGFGFISTNGGDIFFHKSGVKHGFESLAVGTPVVFVFGEGDRGAKAEDISAV